MHRGDPGHSKGAEDVVMSVAAILHMPPNHSTCHTITACEWQKKKVCLVTKSERTLGGPLHKMPSVASCISGETSEEGAGCCTCKAQEWEH